MDSVTTQNFISHKILVATPARHCACWRNIASGVLVLARAISMTRPRTLFVAVAPKHAARLNLESVGVEVRDPLDALLGREAGGQGLGGKKQRRRAKKQKTKTHSLWASAGAGEGA